MVSRQHGRESKCPRVTCRCDMPAKSTATEPMPLLS